MLKMFAEHYGIFKSKVQHWLGTGYLHQPFENQNVCTSSFTFFINYCVAHFMQVYSSMICTSKNSNSTSISPKSIGKILDAPWLSWHTVCSNSRAYMKSQITLGNTFFFATPCAKMFANIANDWNVPST